MLASDTGYCDSTDHCSTKYRNYSTELKPSYLHCISENALAYRTLGQQLDVTIAKFPNTEAIVSHYEGKRYTFSSIRTVVDRIGAGLLKLGLKKGDPVGIWGPNSINWYVTMMATARVGLVSVAINPAFQGPELEQCLKKVNVKAIVAAETFKTQRYYEIIRSICPELNNSQVGNIKSQRLPELKVVIIDSKGSLPGALKFDDLLSIADKNDIQQVADRQYEISADQPCNIQFSSGTTGDPKAIVLTHFSIVNNGYFSGKRSELNNQRICVLNPFFHIAGMVATLVAALCHGATVVIPSAGFNPEDSLKAIVDEKCTMIGGTPTMYVDLIKKQKELQLPVKTLEIAAMGGAASLSQLSSDMKNVFGVTKVKNVYGMTETLAIFQAMVDEDDKDTVINNVGQLLDHMEAKVIDVEGNTVAFGQPGELCVRGYSVMLNYFHDEKRTNEVLSECRWLHTGDQFILYENGYGQFVGRLKEMIIRGGENIYSTDIEDFLSTHPDILEVQVIGVDDQRMGEELCAYVRLTDIAHEITQEDVKQFCKGKIAHFKIPRYVRLVKNFPKTTSGKIQKFKLKDMFKKEQELFVACN